MSTFCTQCGAALQPESTFCTGCGTAVQTPTHSARKPRRWPWLLALIVLFALGFWLGRLLAPKCPQCPAPAAGAGGGGGGGGGGGRMGGGPGAKGDPDKGAGGGGSGNGQVLGAGGRADGSGGGGGGGGGGGKGGMEGGGAGSGSGTTVGQGHDGAAAGAQGSDDANGGDSSGKSKLDGGHGPDTDQDVKKSTEAGVWRLAAGAPLSAGSGDALQSNPQDAATQVLTARDFTYDRTGLPRYPAANQAIFSALSYDTPGRTDSYGSASGIVTGSSFEEVVAWYHRSLPGGWTNTTLSDLNRLGAIAQQLTPDKIAQMINPQSGSAPTASGGEVPATAAADRVQLSLFSAPAGTKGDPGMMVIQHGDKPIEILMKTHIMP